MREEDYLSYCIYRTALDDPEHISVDGYGEVLWKIVEESDG